MYGNSMDRDYIGNLAEEKKVAPRQTPEIRASDISPSVTEGGRFGNLIQSAQGMIRLGAAKVELQLQQGGGQEPVGPDSYGKEARQTLREISKVNQVQFAAVHAPVTVGNVSGFNPETGFSEQQRGSSVEEIKKAIEFSADVAGGSPVVVHTGEFFRPMEGADWNRKLGEGKNGYEFLAYQEEPGRAIKYLVDRRTGQIQANVRKSQIYIEPKFMGAEHDMEGYTVDGKRKVHIKKGDWVTEDGRWIDATNPDELKLRKPFWDPENNKFETQTLTWEDIEKRTKWWNDRYREKGERPIKPEEMAFRIQAENGILQAKGNALYYSRQYQEAVRERDVLKQVLKHYQDIEKDAPPEVIRDMMIKDPQINRDPLVRQLWPKYDERRPTVVIEEALKRAEADVLYIREGSAAADARAAEIELSLQHVIPMEEYAKQQSAHSYAELGIHAMQQTKENPHVKKDVFVAPENIFPEMGYGSHPEELIELVTDARKQMVKLLTSPKIEDPHGRRKADGSLELVPNPYFHKGIDEHKAEEMANKHIRATLDTQHLSMWRKYFQPQYQKGEGRMETPEETDKRFNKWYINQVEKLSQSGILGHIHLVDAFGSGHSHLPAGQGKFPVVDAVRYLKKKGYDGSITSEGYGESAYGPDRIFTKVLEAFDSPTFSGMYSGGFGRPNYWSGVAQSYFGTMVPPYFIFGAYTPSNEWKFWSEVPLE